MSQWVSSSKKPLLFRGLALLGGAALYLSVLGMGSLTLMSATGLGAVLVSSTIVCLSFLGMLMSPLPVLGAVLYFGGGFGFGAVLVSSAIVGAIQGLPSALCYAALSGCMGLSVGLCARQKRSLGEAIVLTSLTVVSAGAGSIMVLSRGHFLSWVLAFRHDMMGIFDLILAAPEITEIMPEGLREQMLFQAPSVMLATLVVVIGLQIAWAVRLWRAWPQKMLGAWSMPLHYVWPTIVLAAVCLFGTPPVAAWSSSVLRVVLAGYFLQGLVILGSMLSMLRLGLLGRFFVACTVTLFLVPLIMLTVCCGFFDLWVDFRPRLQKLLQGKVG